ncbi:hypothetical protein NSQ26_00985 [Bacillus sp. FSL W7-1360]
MKKVVTIAATGLFILLSGCNTTEQEEEKAQPESASTSNTVVKIEAAIAAPLSLEEALTDADLVAEVKIQEIVGEVEETLPKTIFSAEVTNVLKGKEEQKTIKLFQNGTKEIGFNDNELFSEGDTYVLFLNETSSSSEADYWIQGEETGMYKVSGDTLVKQALPYEALAPLEVQTLKSGSESDVQQVLDKNRFYELITEKGGSK